MKNLLWTQFFVSLGNGIIGIFYPFLLVDKFGLEFWELFILVGIIFGIMGLLVYPINYLFNTIKIPQKLAIGTLFLSLFYFGLIFLTSSFFNLILLISCYVLFLILFWPNFHWAIIHNTETKKRGNFLGNFQVILMLTTLIAPPISGFIIDEGYKFWLIFVSGFSFLIACLLALTIPIKTSPQLPKSSLIFKFFKEYTQDKDFVRASFVEALQTSSLILIYPVLMKLIVTSYTLVGSFFTLMAFVEIFSAKLFGKLVDKYSSEKLIKWGAWARFFDIAPRGLLAFFPSEILMSILAISAGLLGPVFGVSFYAQVYKRAENSSDIFSFLITREWILGFVRLLFLTFIGIGFYYFDIYILGVALLIAGLGSFFLKKM